MSLLTTCNMSNIFSGAWFWSQADIGLSLKSNNHSQVKFVRIPSTQGLKEDYIIEKCFCFIIDLKETLNDWKVSTLIRSSHVFALGPSNCCDDEKVERWKVTNNKNDFQDFSLKGPSINDVTQIRTIFGPLPRIFMLLRLITVVTKSFNPSSLRLCRHLWMTRNVNSVQSYIRVYDRRFFNTPSQLLVAIL